MRIQLEYSEKVDPSVKERLENDRVTNARFLSIYHDRVQYGPRVSLAVKENIGKTCKVFPFIYGKESRDISSSKLFIRACLSAGSLDRKARDIAPLGVPDILFL